MTIITILGMNKRWIKDKTAMKAVCDGNHPAYA